MLVTTAIWVMPVAAGAQPSQGQPAGGASIETNIVVEAGEIPPGYRFPLPVTARYVRGTLADADFTLFLPQASDWNGKTVIFLPGGYGDERHFPFELRRGYAVASTDSGFRFPGTLGRGPDQILEATYRAKQLTGFTRGQVRQEYGTAAQQTYVAGFSAGAHTAKLLAERNPGLVDGAISVDTLNSWFEIGRQIHFALNSCGADQADPRVFSLPAELRNGGAYELGFSRVNWQVYWQQIWCRIPFIIDGVRALIRDTDPGYDPNGDGTLSRSEVIAWNPGERRPAVENRLRRLDANGKPRVPMILLAGEHSAFQASQQAYRRLAEQAGARVQYYERPGGWHGNTFTPAFYLDALDALEPWIDDGVEPGQLGVLRPQ